MGDAWGCRFQLFPFVPRMQPPGLLTAKDVLGRCLKGEWKAIIPAGFLILKAFGGIV